MAKLPIELITKKAILKNYRLDDFVYDDIIKSNIAFTLQYIFFNFELAKNYSLQKSLKAITCKQLLVNTFSVLEGMMFGAADTLQRRCNNVEACKEACDYYLSDDTAKFIKFDTVRAYLRKIGALDFSEHGKEFVRIAKDLRNNIHIGKSVEIESENSDYSIGFIEESLDTIKEIAIVLADFVTKQEETNRCMKGRYRMED